MFYVFPDTAPTWARGIGGFPRWRPARKGTAAEHATARGHRLERLSDVVCSKGHAAVAEANARDNLGLTALHLAAAIGHAEFYRACKRLYIPAEALSATMGGPTVFAYVPCPCPTGNAEHDFVRAHQPEGAQAQTKTTRFGPRGRPPRPPS